MTEALTLTVTVLTAVTLAGGIGAAVVKLALLPWLKEHLVKPIQETRDSADEVHRQVTVNKHVSPEPTLLDKVDLVRQDIRIAALMFEGHIKWSSDESRRIWKAIDELKEGNTP